MSAPVASGWSGRRVGLAPTGKAPPCHGARGKRSFHTRRDTGSEFNTFDERARSSQDYHASGKCWGGGFIRKAAERHEMLAHHKCLPPPLPITSDQAACRRCGAASPFAE